MSVGLGLFGSLTFSCASTPSAVTPPVSSVVSATDPFECMEGERTLQGVELQAEQAIVVGGGCELSLVDVVVRGEGTVLSVIGDGEVELMNSRIYGNVVVTGNGEFEAEQSEITGDIQLAGSSTGEFKKSTVSGKIEVAETAKLEDRGDNTFM